MYFHLYIREFEINVFAGDLVSPRMIAMVDNEAVCVTLRDVGDVIKLIDADKDGVAEQQDVQRFLSEKGKRWIHYGRSAGWKDSRFGSGK